MFCFTVFNPPPALFANIFIGRKCIFIYRGLHSISMFKGSYARFQAYLV